MYGANFPGFDAFDNKSAEKWRKWIDGKLEEQEQPMRDKRLHAARHRHFKQGRQWISTRDGRTLREPGHDRNTVRAVLNLIGPSLDYRLGVLREQRPGFRFEPLGGTIEAQEQSEAQQITVEYYFNTLRAWIVFQDAFQAAQTDGTAFIHVFKDKRKGKKVMRVTLIPPGDERFEVLKAQGYRVREDGMLEVPANEAGEPIAEGEAQSHFIEGDIGHRVVAMHETLADPEAKTVNGPYDRAKWFIIQRIRDIKSVRLETDNPDLEPEVSNKAVDVLEDSVDGIGQRYTRGIPRFPTSRRRKQDGIMEYLVFFNSGVDEAIPDGAWIKVTGKSLFEGEKRLPGGMIPVAAVHDGSSDSDLYKRPVMSDWIGDQMIINALVSMAIMHGRVLGGGRALIQKNTQLNETFTSILGSVVEYSGMKPDFMTPPRMSGDIWQLIGFFVQKLEDKTSWNAFSRGQVSGSQGGGMQDVSGRAVLGAKELFERALGPMVRAAADAVTEWAQLVVVLAADLFDTPRLLPLMGGRTDLAKKISKEMLSGPPSVYADPETLMPMPRSLQNQMLFDLWKSGVISVQEYKNRAPYGFIRDVYAGDQTQVNRAQMVNEILLENYETLFQAISANPLALFDPVQGVPVLWADDPEVHRNALLQLVLDDKKPWPMRQLAMTRFAVYEDLAASKTPPIVDEKTGQTSEPAPVPLEVIGAPAGMKRAPQPQPLAKPQTAPGREQVSAPAPEIAGAPTEAQGVQAQPLGQLGSEEANQAAGSALPR
jgi:hypothetical protein